MDFVDFSKLSLWRIIAVYRLTDKDFHYQLLQLLWLWTLKNRLTNSISIALTMWHKCFLSFGGGGGGGGGSIKYIGCDPVILEAPHHYTCRYAFFLRPMSLVRTYGYDVLKKIQQINILWITISQRSANNFTN